MFFDGELKIYFPLLNTHLICFSAVIHAMVNTVWTRSGRNALVSVLALQSKGRWHDSPLLQSFGWDYKPRYRLHDLAVSGTLNSKHHHYCVTCNKPDDSLHKNAILYCTTLRKSTETEGWFRSMPYNQTFDFVTGQFVKILSPDSSRRMSITLKPFEYFDKLLNKHWYWQDLAEEIAKWHFSSVEVLLSSKFWKSENALSLELSGILW